MSAIKSLAIALLFLMPTPAFAVLSLSDNFESYGTGALAGNSGGTGWAAGWTDIETTGGQIQVVSTPTNSGTRAAGRASMTSESEVERTFASETSGSFTLYMRRSVNNSDNWSVYVGDSGSNYRCKVTLDSTGQIEVQSTNIQAYSANTWYQLTIEVDASTDQIRASIDGGAFSSWIACSTASTGYTSISIRRDNAGAGTQDNWFDDIGGVAAAATTYDLSNWWPLFDI